MTTSVVDDIQGGYGDQAIATTSNGDIHIVYWNYDTHELKHAIHDGTSWTRTVIQMAGGSFDYRDVEMVVDSNDHLHVSHWATEIISRTDTMMEPHGPRSILLVEQTHTAQVLRLILKITPTLFSVVPLILRWVNVSI